jgi:hypothetical protein
MSFFSPFEFRAAEKGVVRIGRVEDNPFVALASRAWSKLCNRKGTIDWLRKVPIFPDMDDTSDLIPCNREFIPALTSREWIAQLTDISNLSVLIFDRSGPILRLSLLFSLLAGNLPAQTGLRGLPAPPTISSVCRNANRRIAR